MKKPRTRPKLNVGKKSRRSRLRTYRRALCTLALLNIDWDLLKPWEIGLRGFSFSISSRQSYSRSARLRCRNLRAPCEPQINRLSPFFFPISYVTYFLSRGVL